MRNESAVQALCFRSRENCALVGRKLAFSQARPLNGTLS